ncbi:MAG: potassium channel protein [Acidimicrobiia bacterium]
MNPRRQIFTGLALLAVVVVVGTFGYVIIEGVSPFDAFYMVAITVSTVGFREEFALSTTGQVWTILIIVMGLGLVLYTAVASIEYLIDLDAVRRRRKMNNDIARLSNHVIVCGWGRVGRGTWNVLSAREVPVVVIEADGDRAEAARSSGALTIHGDATHNDVLELAGVDSAQSAIACVADDSDNLVIALSVKALRPELRVICRATELESERKLRLAGADAVVAPQAVGAERLAMMALQPELAQIFDIVVNGSPVEFRVEELDIAADGHVAGKTIRDSGIRQESGALILAVEGGPESLVVNPGPDLRLMAGERLVVVGTKDQVDKAAQLVNPTAEFSTGKHA